MGFYFLFLGISSGKVLFLPEINRLYVEGIMNHAVSYEGLLLTGYLIESCKKPGE